MWGLIYQIIVIQELLGIEDDMSIVKLFQSNQNFTCQMCNQ